jgi:hypothetical protein
MSSPVSQSQLILSSELLFLGPDHENREPFSEPRSTRAESYRHITRLIEVIWPNLIKELNKNDGQIFYSDIKFDRNSVSQLLDLNVKTQSTSDELLKKIVLKDPRRHIWSVRDAYCQLVSKSLMDEFKKIKDHPDFIAGTKLITELDQYVHLEPDIRLMSILRGGFHTATFFIFDIIRVAPILYFKQHQRALNTEQLKLIVNNSLKTMMMVASIHREVLSSLRRFSQTVQYAEALPPEREPNDYEFPIHFFEYDLKNEQIVLKHKALMEWRKETEALGQLPSTQRIGCPARQAKQDTSQEKSDNVIVSLLESQLNFTLKYLEPALVKYSQS